MQQLLLRDGKYRLSLSLSDLEQPHEVILHGISHLADAQTIANILEVWLAGRSHTLWMA